MMPISVIPTCTELRKASGSANSFKMVFARLLPWSASACMRLGFTDTSAISLNEKKLFSRVSSAMIRISIGYTATLCSLNASFSDVFRSVLSLRWPMISAQGTPYSPAGNCFGKVPGITTERGGT